MLTKTQKIILQNCDECMSEQCAICKHEPCPECVDDCDHPDCLLPGENIHPTYHVKLLEKTHTCVFERCKKHKNLETIIDLKDING